MAVNVHTCVSLLCDGPNCHDGGWDDGVPHFPTVDEAVDYAQKLGWLITNVRALCPTCAAAVECAATAHRWAAWDDRVSPRGIEFRRRLCGHCGGAEYDPPFEELLVLSDLAQIVDEADS